MIRVGLNRFRGEPLSAAASAAAVVAASVVAAAAAAGAAALVVTGRVRGAVAQAVFQHRDHEIVRLAVKTGCTEAVLKARSPSCGCGEVYDGTFSGTLTKGWGCAARALTDAGLRVITEEDLAAGETAAGS